MTEVPNQKHAYDNGLCSMKPARKKRLENVQKYNWINKNGVKFYGSIRELIENFDEIPCTSYSLMYKVSNPDLIYKHYKYGYNFRVDWAPGSDGAINKFAGTCPQIDNHYGRGIDGEGLLYYINENCPIHGRKKGGIND